MLRSLLFLSLSLTLAGCGYVDTWNDILHAKENKTTYNYDFSIPNPGDDISSLEKDQTKWEIDGAGLTIKVPEFVHDVKGNFIISGGEEIYPGDGVVYMTLNYLGHSDEEYEAFMEQILNPDEDTTVEEYEVMISDFYKPFRTVFSVYALDHYREFDELNEYFEQMYAAKPNFAKTKKLGSSGGYNFYMVQNEYSEEDLKEAMGEYYEEYRDVYSRMPEFMEGLEMYLPVTNPSVVDQEDVLDLGFEMTDMDGKSHKLSDAVNENTLTMISFFETSDPESVTELTALQELNKKYGEKGLAVFAIGADILDEDSVYLAIANSQEAKSEFPVCVPPVGIENVFSTAVYPTTYFVDQKGRLVGEPIYGSSPEMYEKRIKKMLGIIDKKGDK